LALVLLETALLKAAEVPAPQPLGKGEDVLIDPISPGSYGGMLVIGQRAEPKTFNPVMAIDAPSR